MISVINDATLDAEGVSSGFTPYIQHARDEYQNSAFDSLAKAATDDLIDWD